MYCGVEIVAFFCLAIHHSREHKMWRGAVCWGDWDGKAWSVFARVSKPRGLVWSGDFDARAQHSSHHLFVMPLRLQQVIRVLRRGAYLMETWGAVGR